MQEGDGDTRAAQARAALLTHALGSKLCSIPGCVRGAPGAEPHWSPASSRQGKGAGERCAGASVGALEPPY